MSYKSRKFNAQLLMSTTFSAFEVFPMKEDLVLSGLQFSCIRTEYEHSLYLQCKLYYSNAGKLKTEKSVFGHFSCTRCLKNVSVHFASPSNIVIEQMKIH